MKVLDALGNGDTGTWDAITEYGAVGDNSAGESPILYMASRPTSKSWALYAAPRPIQLVSARASKGSLVAQFEALADTWERETRAESFAHRRSMHPAYQRIIGLGPPAIPLILERMRERQSGHWFWALNALTGEDPAAGLTRPRDARDAWYRWGVDHGYVAGS